METLTEAPKKEWFRINKNVEYSTSFKFFRENQIYIIKSGTRHKFCSRLESKVFLEKICPYFTGDYPESDIFVMTMKIHNEILAGKHGKGKFVD